MPKQRGMGHVFRRGRVYWIKYSVRGRVFRESAKSEAREVATNLLKVRLAEMLHRPVTTAPEETNFEDLVALLTEDYQRNQRKSLDRALRCAIHLRRFFGDRRATDIQFDTAAHYVTQRLNEKAAHATVKQEIAVLGRMLTLAVRAGRLRVKPHLPLIKVRNTRSGFFEKEELNAILDQLPAYLLPMIRFMAITGWRVGEVKGLTWNQVDMAAGVVRLEPGTTKNEEGRSFPFGASAALKQLIATQRELTTATEKQKGVRIPWVFHRDGNQIRSFRDTWRRACRDAGYPDKLVHDLRRTAVRNLERAGISRSVAMKLTGHKTESVYRRYAIVSEGDLREAVSRLDGHSSVPLVKEPRGD